MKIFLVAAVLASAFAGTIQPSLIAKVKTRGTQDAILELPSIMDKVESSAILKSLKGDAKVAGLVRMLEELTKAAQAPYVGQLKQLGVEYEQFWASNIVLMKNVELTTIEQIAAFSEDDVIIREQVFVTLDTVVNERDTNISQNVQWGVAKIRAPEAWTVTDGSGVIVGIIDTGANVEHEALKNNYAGTWLDPYYNSANPTDTNGHGSHALGTIVGQTNGIGVAPGAQWVACRGINNEGSGSETALTTCAQFMLQANPRPQIVSNYWGGGSGDWFISQISAWRNAGLIPVFPIGNSGPACGTAGSPGDNPNVLACGVTTQSDALATLSSRGPSIKGTLKPDFSAPGINIVSSWTGKNDYVTLSGMSVSHLAGSVALVLAKYPNFTFDEVYAALATSAAQPPLTSADRDCGLEGEEDYPNNAFGWGRIDVGKAVGV